MGIINREGALYMATGVDNTGLYAGRREAIGIIKALTSQITSFDVFGGIGISAAMAFANAAKSSYDFEKEFRKNMLEVATISTQIGGSMTDFMNRVMAITQQIPVTAPEAAKALYQIVSAGHDGADGMKILEVSAKSAVGGLTDTATAADAITTVLNAYKLSADQAANISDQLFTTVRLGKTDFGQLGQSIAQVAPIAASYGVEIDQVLAAVASLTKQGTPTAQAMTQIRAAIIGTSKVLGDGAFEGRTFQEALAEVAARANGSESKLRELVPEIEAVNGVLGMTGQNAKAAASDLGELQNSAGSTEAAFQKMQEDVDNQMKLLSNNIHAALRPMGEVILKNVSEAAQMINKGFETGDVQNSLESLKKLLIGVAGVYVTYKSSVIGASAAEAFHSAKVAVSNNLKSLQSKITGEATLAKEKERVYQEAYTAALEKSITQEQRAKLSKLNLKAGSQEYVKALADQALQEKKNADNLVESLTKQVNKNKERLASAQENLEMSHKAVDAAKAEFDAAFAANDLAGVEAAQTKINAAAQREEAASANVATASKKLKTTQSKLSSAAIAAETAATRVNTAATAADTAVTNVSTTAKGKLKIATSALWGVMKANPIGAVLTAISLATTVYMVFADKIKAAETAQSRLNKLNKAAAESISNETAELNLLLSVAKNELLAKGEREKAIKKLNEISPEYLNNLTLENIGTKEAATSIEAYTRAIGKNAKAKALIDEMNPLYRDQLKYEQELYVLQKKSDDLKTNKLGFSDEQLYYANLDISAQIKNKEAQKAEVDKQIQDVLDMYNDELTKETEKNPIKVEIPVNIQIQSEQANISALLKKKEEIEARIQARKENGLFADAFDAVQLVAVNDELKRANDRLISLNKESSKKTEEKALTVLQRQLALTKELAAAEAKLKKLRASDSTATDQEIDEAEKKRDEIKKKLQALTGISAKEGNDLLKAQSELSRLILDSELKLQSERIAIMQDGNDKRVLLADQEYKETLAAIEKERAEYQKNTRDAGQPEDAAIMATFSSRESAAKDKRDTNVANINKEYFDEYTKRTKALTDVFLSEEKKRLSAVKERYDEERKWANEELKTGGMSGEQYEAYVVNINTAETEESLRGLLDKYQDYATERKRIEEQFQAEIETLEKGRTQNNAANVDAAIAEAREKEREALSNLDLENLQKEINWSTVFGDLEKVSTDTLKRLQEQLKDYLSKVGDTISKEDLKVVTDALTQIGEVQADRRPIDQLKVGYEDYKKACERVAIAQQRVNELEAKGNKTSEEYKKAIEGLTAAQDERRSSLVSMTQAVNSIGQKGSELVQAGNDIVGMLTDLGVEMPESIAGALDGLGQIASSLASIDLTKPFSVVTGITGIIGGIGKAIGSLFNKDHKKEKNIQRIQEQVDALDRSYNKLGDSIEKAYSKDASELIGQQNEMLEQQKVLIQQQIREEEEKKKTDHDRIKQWENELEEIDRVIADNKEKAKDAIFGEDLKSAIDNFANAYAEAWAAGEDRAKSMKDVARSMIRQTVIELIKSSEGLGETVKKIREMIIGYLEDGVIDEWEQKQIDDYIESETSRLDSKYEWADKYLQGDKSIDIGISSDSLSDTILEGLQAGKSGIKDFSSSFEDMMKTAVLNSLKLKYLEGPLKEFQKKFTELSESGGQLTEAEIEELRAMYADIIDGAKVQFDSMKEISGLDFSLDSDNTLKGAFAKASQESIDLLAGQTGAQRVAVESIREQLRIIFDLQREGWADVRAIRELTVKIDRNSEQMAKNTDKIQEVAEKISESTKKTAECLDGTISVKVKM